MRLSAIDTLWPDHVVALAPFLDALGFHRLWATEHHDPRQSASPIVMAAIVAGLTRRMRVGTAGIMLQLRSPLQVAEDIRLLERLYPGRIDLGLVGALPPEPIRTALLDGRSPPDEASYARKVAELAELVSIEPVAEPAADDARAPLGTWAAPVATTAPELWLCGTSRRTAALAARLGAGFAYLDHAVPGTRPDGPAVVDAYRQGFRPGGYASVPTVVVACFGMCAPDGARAERSWFPVVGLPPTFLGDPDRCREQLLEIAVRYGVSELVVQCVAAALPARLDAYRLLAEALELPAPPA